MGDRTPNLNLYKPSIAPLETGWGDEVNGNFDTIDELLNGAAQSVYLIAGKVNYVANAVYTNGVWNRLNTGMGAVRLALDPSAQTIVVYHAAAGSNPISWTTLQTFSSDGLNAGAKKITNLATPTAATDAATKAYIDGLIAALKLSQIAIDADKNWNGKSITNVGSIDTLSGNIGARTGFVDSPGNTTRKSFSPGTVLGTNETATVATTTIPANYSSAVDSNLRITIVKSTDYRYDHYLGVTIKRNGETIGNGSIAYDVGSGNIDTTGGCKAGDTITVEAKNVWGGTYYVDNITIYTVTIKTTRRADIPAYKVFAETGAW